MKIFLKKTSSILLIFFIGVLSSILIIHFIIKYKADFSIPNGNKYVIFGHSHPAAAFNDNLILNFKNLSKSAEGYFYTYQKVKEILPKNDINAIFIEYSNNLIGKDMDEWIWGPKKMDLHFSWHSSFMSKEDILLLYKKNPNDFPIVVSSSTRKNLTRILTNDFSIGPDYGGYSKLEQPSIITELIKERESNIIDTLKEHEISIYSINYLEKIIDFCNSSNIKIFLIRSPQHKFYPRENEKELISFKNERFENIDFLDFSKFPLEDDEFLDFGHLNHKGAEVFSLWFNELIKNGLLTEKNKTAFIKTEIEKIRSNKNANRSLNQ